MSILNNISVKNFGPIIEANIDISPLTIFVGKNSSGKSFLSLLIHCMFNPFDDIDSKYNSESFPIHSYEYLIENDKELFDEFDYELMEFIESKPSLDDKLISQGFGRCYVKLIEEKIKNNWKVDLNDLNRKGEYPFEITLNNNTFKNSSGKLCSRDFFKNINLEFSVVNEMNSEVIKITYLDDLVLNFDYKLWNKMFGDENVSISQIIYILIVDKLIKTLKTNTVYIPASGDVFKNLNIYMSKEIRGNNNSTNIQKEVISNLLAFHESFEKGFFYNLACEMEKEITGGELIFEEAELGKKIIFNDVKNNVKLDLGLLSSSVRELLPIIMNLKFFLNKGDVLILEEIENHLHPENQLILIKYLIKAINMGLNLVVTTHSDFIIEKMNNLIRLGNAKKEAFEELNYDESDILNFEDTRIYNFKKISDYNFEASKVDINFTGFNDENFSQVLRELYDESSIIIRNKLR